MLNRRYGSLAQGLVEETNVSAAVTAFEEDMFERVEEAAKESADAAATFLSHDSLVETLAMYLERLSRMREALRDGTHERIQKAG